MAVKVQTVRVQTAKNSKPNQSIVKTLVSYFDVIPVIKCNYHLSLNNRIFHTILGLTLMLIFQLIPYYGLYYINRQTFISSVVSRTKTMVSLTKNSAMLAPLAFALFTRTLDLKVESNKQRQSLYRGLRNLGIFVGVFFRYVYLFLFKELKNSFVSLVSPSSILSLLLVYVFQNALASVCVVWIEDYLQNFGVNTRFNFSYYQATEIVLQIYSSPVPGNLGILNLVFILLTLVTLITQDRVYSEKIVLRHNMVSGVTRTIQLKPSTIVSNSVFTYKVLKTAFYNTIDLLINPLLTLYQVTYRKIPAEKAVMVPSSFLDSPIFNENYIMLLYLPSWKNRLALLCGLAMIIDYVILLPLITLNSNKFSLDLDPDYLQKKIAQSNLRIVERQTTTSQYLHRKLRNLMVSSAVVGSVFQLACGMLPIYGIILTANVVVYFYGRIEGILDSIKQSKKSQLPEALRVFKPLI